MFEAAEVGEKLDKSTYSEKLPSLREALLDAQFRLHEADFSVIVLIAGADGSGKGEMVNRLLDWLDARGVETHAIDKPTDEENQRPPFFRFWRRLPPKGKLSIFFGSWYSDPMTKRIAGSIDDVEFERDMQRIVEFERMLTDEGVLLIKIWLHITKKQQKRNLKRLESNPETKWRVTKRDWALHKTYDEFIRIATSGIRQTSSGHAPWKIVEAADKRYRNVRVAEHILEHLERRLNFPCPEKHPPEPLPVPNTKNVINVLKLHQPLSRKDYDQELSVWQTRLSQLVRQMTVNDLSALLVFEGSDSAGKGGCIRRIVHALDARFYRVIPVGAPTDEELAHPYMWRFWRTLPRSGHIHVYDRSWYGRVLVERIEGFCDRTDWLRAYSEINAFERELSLNRVLVIKFWLAISSDEQLRRFEMRQETPYKRYKLTDEDWRNREKAPAYEAAACDMIVQTSSTFAPWTLVEADNKLFARIKVLRTVCERLEQELAQPQTTQKSDANKKRK